MNLHDFVMNIRRELGENSFEVGVNPFWQDGKNIEICYGQYDKWEKLLNNGYNQKQLEKYFIEWLKWKYPKEMKKCGTIFRLKN